MRILHVITSLSVGGAETMLRNVVLGADRGQFESSVLSLTTKDKIGVELETAGVPLHVLNARGGLLLPRHLAAARRFARSVRPDLIQAWMYHGNVLSYWLVTAVSSSPKLITSVRGALDAPRAQKRALRFARWVDAQLSGRADAIIFNSASSARQHVAAGYAGDRVRIVPNGFDTDRFRPMPDRRALLRHELGLNRAVAIGLVGRFDPLKGHRKFLRAASMIAARNDQLMFALIGRSCDCENPHLRDWIAEDGLEGRVLLLGERSDIPSIMNALDVVVCPSISESFPNAVGEAMACGKACVVTDVGDCRHLVGDAGYVVPPDDDAQLAAAIAHLASSEAVREAMGAKARGRIAGEFALGRIVSGYTDLYRLVLAH